MLELLIKTIHLTIFIHNLKTNGPIKISIPFFSFLDNLLKDAYIIFQKGVNNFEIEYKTR